jgi:hypothetical protein
MIAAFEFTFDIADAVAVAEFVKFKVPGATSKGPLVTSTPAKDTIEPIAISASGSRVNEYELDSLPSVTR